MPHMHRVRAVRRSVGGYTLIELLMVVALMGLAASLLIPQLNNRDSLRVQAAVRQLIADLSFAQSDALARQEHRRVHFYDDGSGYCIVRSDGTDDFDADTADYIFDPLANGDQQYIRNIAADSRFDGVTITSVDIDGGESDIIYDQLGGTVQSSGLPGVGGTIELSGGGFVYEVRISPFTGKLTVVRTS
jgi:prepilin-type N-terminal cleavage/methylation domain-containing protein